MIPEAKLVITVDEDQDSIHANDIRVTHGTLVHVLVHRKHHVAADCTFLFDDRKVPDQNPFVERQGNRTRFHLEQGSPGTDLHIREDARLTGETGDRYRIRIQLASVEYRTDPIIIVQGI